MKRFFLALGALFALALIASFGEVDRVVAADPPPKSCEDQVRDMRDLCEKAVQEAFDWCMKTHEDDGDYCNSVYYEPGYAWCEANFDPSKWCPPAVTPTPTPTQVIPSEEPVA